MQHVKPTSKGDPLCPLGFHPQVRWPTRCKRCFRDYKEHGNRSREQDSQLRKDELTVSTPAISTLTYKGTNDADKGGSLGSRNWTSSTNLSSLGNSNSNKHDDFGKFSSTSSSWTSSPNLAEEKEDTPNVTVSFTLPRRKKSTTDEPPRKDLAPDDEARKTQYTFRRRTSPSTITSSPNYDSSASLPPAKPPSSSAGANSSSSTASSYRARSSTREEPQRQNKSEVDFLLQVKSSPKVTTRSSSSSRVSAYRKSDEFDSDDEGSVQTSTTDTTLVNHEKELQEEIESLKKELEAMKVRCERAEREKSDFMLRRLASETVTSSTRTSASEFLKLQQKVNELKANNEDLRDEKKSYAQRVRELECDLDAIKASGVQREVQVLRDKLNKAENMCDRLAEANEEMKKEIRDMEEEMDEMQDKFREDRADEYTSLKKELEQQTKNCRILSFKLRKAEKKAETLDAEKLEAERKCREVAGGQVGLDKVERIKQLEHDLSVANEAAARLQKELEEANSKLKSSDKDKGSSTSSLLKKKAPKLGTVPKTPSGDKVSRESLTRGDSQEDPVQLLRDLQDSLEREADLREQLRFAEEEAANLRKKASRVEDDNESLVLQLKKMATKARTRRLSPSHNRLTPEPVEKDEGISDEDDPSELRMLLELNEQESSVLRRKVEDLEVEGDHLKRKVKDLQEMLNSKSTNARRAPTSSSSGSKTDTVTDKKIKVLEEEMGQIRMKLIEKERECERLHAEISSGGKKQKTLVKSRSLDGDQQTVDLKRQLQVIESEANVLRSKTQELEADNEKLVSENRRLTMLSSSRRSSSVERLGDSKTLNALEKQLDEANKRIKELEQSKPGASRDSAIPVGEIEALKKQVKKIETEKKKQEEVLKRLKEEAVETVTEYYKKRVPKKPTDLTTKLQMKKMVDDLENEISEILVVLKKSGGTKAENELSSLKTEFEKTKAKLDGQIKEAKDQCESKDKEVEKLNKILEELENEKVKLKKEAEKSKTSLEKEVEKLKETKTDLEKDKKQLNSEIDKLKLALKQETAKDESKTLKKKIETLTVDLDNARKESESLKKQLDLAAQSSTENSKLIKELEEKTKNLEEVGKKLKETEDKLKKSEKLVSSKKEKIVKMEKDNEELGGKYIELEKEKNSMLTEKKSLQNKLDEAEKKLKSLQEDLDSKTKELNKLESGSAGDAETKKPLKPSAKSAQEIKELKEELAASKEKSKELAEKLEKTEEELKKSESNFERRERKFTREIEEWEKKASELEMDLQEATEEIAAERKLMERLRASQESEMKAKDLEITQLRTDSLSASKQKIQEMQSQIDRLEMALESEKREYDELTSKYEQLEEEHVVIKASLVKEKEKIQSELVKTEADLEEAEEELTSVRATFNAKQDCWIKEKLKFEDKMNEYDTLVLEKNRLQAFCDEKQSEIDQYKKETHGLKEQIDYMKKDNEELRRQIEDYEKVSKVHRSMNADVTALEKELKEYKTRLVMEEKAKKTELSKLKHRYDHRIAVLSDEMLSIQGQVARFKRERDSYRHMLEEAHRNIQEFKNTGTLSNRYSMDGDELKMHMASLEQQISVMEDQLSESRLEASRLRTELVSERSAWEVKLSELNSKLNELEEEKIMNSGRTKITGLKTKMELAWHKEREEQHRLLQETSTLARDLRQTLFEVERERDRERLESKRRIEQLKKTADEENDEIRKKLSEMQCDLLELRDAHAKLRTTNEKLRREKDKYDRERDMFRQSLSTRKRNEEEAERQIISVSQLVEQLTDLAPELFPSKPRPVGPQPTPPVRRKGKSRESSPLMERKEFSREPSLAKEDAKTHEVNEILRRLSEAAEQLKKSQRMDSTRRSFSSFRSSSIESDGGSVENVRRRTGVQRKNSTLRKSLSLEQTSPSEQQQIYMDDTEGSMTSIQSLEDMEKFRSLHRREQSYDSRLSGGSTQSEVIPSSNKKKKLSLFGKLTKKLTKSRSIDNDGSEAGSTGRLDPGSDVSLAEDKGSFRDKFTGVFKKSGSTSRGNSVERSLKPPATPRSSVERPLVNDSKGESSNRPLTRKPPATAPVQRKVLNK
ncbi:SOGA family member [Nesidiocoris tenuis]|uniref:SOGA family member n=1 Tax=Nesidiocoris tenuis TaxID=355587 RepID=A0ABN7AK04_9HEMI|nr:SOGA family member [Nesidiocoris tenuis]